MTFISRDFGIRVLNPGDFVKSHIALHMYISITITHDIHAARQCYNGPTGSAHRLTTLDTSIGLVRSNKEIRNSIKDKIV